MLVLMGLMKNDVLQYDMRTQLIMLTPALLGIVNINILSRPAWGPQQQQSSLWSFMMRSISVRSYAVHADASTASSLAVDPCTVDSSLSLMKSPALNAAFALYVEKALCYESYKFLLDATTYADSMYATPTEQVSTVLYTDYSIAASRGNSPAL
jgi:hypothetical protein